VTVRGWLWVERLAIAVSSLALAVLLISLLSGYFTNHDQGAVSGGSVVGFHYADQGDTLLAPGSKHPRYDSDPPTSGPHVPVPVIADEVRLTDDQLLDALAAGNVVLMYGTPRPPAGLAALATSLSAPFTPALAASGDAVILAQRPGTRGIVALAWTRLLSVGDASDPLLRQFINAYLGFPASSANHAATLPVS
jgi:hypothetical protein